MPNIFVSAFPFGDPDPEPLNLLRATGWKFRLNPLSRVLTDDEVMRYALDCDGIIAGTEDLKQLIKNSERLKVISRVGIGLDCVPLHECRRKGITVTYTPDAVTSAVAEMTVGLMISLARNIVIVDRETRRNAWLRPFGRRLGKSIIGIVGFGRIGTSVAKLLLPFQPIMVLVNDLKDKQPQIGELRDLGLNISHAQKEEIFTASDIVSLHVPLWAKTRNMVDARTLMMFKKDAYLMNLSRGGIVNETDLYHALKENRLAGAAIDCFETEPYSGFLTEMENVILTQHMGSCSFDCHARMEIEATKDLISFFSGNSLQNEVPKDEFGYQSSG
ncbi:MAG: dehydrogenase [Desulfobacteraceae bacterium]|nr:MAG: dehydrogenase [Desulfobacteraceae bacterium]